MKNKIINKMLPVPVRSGDGKRSEARAKWNVLGIFIYHRIDIDFRRKSLFIGCRIGPRFLRRGAWRICVERVFEAPFDHFFGIDF